MNIDFDSLASSIVYQKQYYEFFKIMNTVIKDRCKSIVEKENTLKINSFFNRQFKNFNYENIDQFIDDDGPLYWYEIFCLLIDNSSDFSFPFASLYQLFDSDIKHQKFIDHLIYTNIHKIFRLYEISDEIPNFKNFYLGRSIFSRQLNKYFKVNFEKIHESFGGFLMLIQNEELPPNIFNIYETLPMFSKYFNDLEKIKKDDYLNFRKFWYYCIKYQKVPYRYILKYIKNFENDYILKHALNTSKNYNHYWGFIELNKLVFNKLKSFETYDQNIITFNMI